MTVYSVVGSFMSEEAVPPTFMAFVAQIARILSNYNAKMASSRTFLGADSFATLAKDINYEIFLEN